MSKSKLMIVFKDSLAGTPEKLRYRVYINSVQIGEGEVGKNRDIASYQITWHENRLVIDEERVIVPKQPEESVIVPKVSYDYVEVKVVAANGSEKTIGRHKHLRPTNTTVTLVSPWVRIPLAGGGMFEGDFFEVEYNIKRKGHNLFAKVIIKDIPRKIVLTALKYRGSKKWAKDVEVISKHLTMKEKTTTYKIGTFKCSTFVHDVLTEVGIAVPWIEHGKSKTIPFYSRISPPTASDWENSEKLKQNWLSVKQPLPGDIGAHAGYTGNATGHVGIILTEGVCISASDIQVEVNDAGFRIKNNAAISNDKDFTNFRRYKHKVIKNG